MLLMTWNIDALPFGYFARVGLNSNISDKLFMISRLWRIGSLQLDKRIFERTLYYIEETWYTLSRLLLQRIVSHALTIIPQIKFPAITPTIYTYSPREFNHPTPPPPLPGKQHIWIHYLLGLNAFKKNPTTNKSLLEPTVRPDKQMLQTAEAAGVP
jgi:hypothetical protein